MAYRCIIAVASLGSYVATTSLETDTYVSNILLKQVSETPAQDCNSICATYFSLFDGCKHTFTGPCGCHTENFAANAECALCKTPSLNNSAQGMAMLQQVFEGFLNTCKDEGFPVAFELPLSPEAQAIVDDRHRQDFRLRRDQRIFLALQISGGHVGLVLLMAIALLSRTAHRNPAFFNFCLTWVISSIFYCILLYHGTAGHTAAVPFTYIPSSSCLAQATLLNGAQVMTACSTMVFVIQLWISLRAVIHGEGFYRLRYQKWTTSIFLALPYIFFFSFAIPSIFSAPKENFLIYPQFQPAVWPTNFYCSSTNSNSLTRPVFGVAIGLLAITVVFDAITVLLLYRHWKAFRQTEMQNPVSLSIFIRVMLFSIYRIAVTITYGTILTRPSVVSSQFSIGTLGHETASSSVPTWIEMLQAATPLVAFLVLGTNTHMINVIMFWKKPKQ